VCVGSGLLSSGLRHWKQHGKIRKNRTYALCVRMCVCVCVYVVRTRTFLVSQRRREKERVRPHALKDRGNIRDQTLSYAQAHAMRDLLLLRLRLCR
jgi:hypothetical protein